VTSSEKKYRKKVSLNQSGSALSILIIIHLVVYVLFAFMQVVWHLRYDDEQVAVSLFTKHVLSWYTLPAELNTLMSQPWTLLTHMFVQTSLWQVFANMLWLWCFGYIMQDLTGNKKIVPVYLYGAFAGALGFMLAYNFIPSLEEAKGTAAYMGASAGVMAIAISTTLVAPGYRLFPMLYGGIPLWVLTSVYLIIDLATISVNDTGTLVSHIFGALTGVLFMFFLKRGYDWSEWMSNFFDWAANLFNPERNRRKRNIKEELFYRSATTPFKRTPNLTQQRIDEILDKINQKGYNSLSDEEKEMLKRASREEL
jgi:membrane associated rhomboid family serine protease